MRIVRLLSALSLAIVAASAQTQIHGRVPAHPQDRIVERIDESTTVTLTGNVHPLAASSTARQIASALPMEHMILTLKGASRQETALEQLIVEQTDAKSPLYHHFLTPEQFGAQFGASANDIQKIRSWLTSYSFTVDEVPAGRRSIVFSGTAEQVSAAFRTGIGTYQVNGVTHYANTKDPEIPAALAGVVAGVVRLHDFPHDSNVKDLRPARVIAPRPDLTSGGTHYLSPADYGTIYDIHPLYGRGINGSGQSIAVIARSNIALPDVEQFRQTFGLPANIPSIVNVNSDPGVLAGDSVETTLDTEWSGAVSPNANVKVIVAASTNSADGIDLAAQFAVNNNVADVITVSYGSCEAAMGSSGMSFYNSLWQQAAAEGITVLVSAGDSGAAGCDSGAASSGSRAAVNGLCTSPYSTCVGGTQFADTVNPGQYWLPGNNPQDGSATGYIPEVVWNESSSDGGSGLWAGGGGASVIFTKPAWQTGLGVPADGRRDVPDVSMAASGHDGYIIVQGGAMWSVGGTSAAAPSFAGLMALAGQQTGARLGNVNPILYPLAANQAAGGAAIFHDTAAGNNSVPGVTGFAAGIGYDNASGLGSVDASTLVSNWPDGAAATPSLSMTASSQTVSVPAGRDVQIVLTTTATHLSAPVTLTLTSLPSNLTATLGSSNIPAPGAGSVALHLVAAANITPGTYALAVTARSGAQTATLSLSVSVPAPAFTLAANSASASMLQGRQAQIGLSASAKNGLDSAAPLCPACRPASTLSLRQPRSRIVRAAAH